MSKLPLRPPSLLISGYQRLLLVVQVLIILYHTMDYFFWKRAEREAENSPSYTRRTEVKMDTYFHSTHHGMVLY
jgi:hypothetical protein